MFGSIGRLADWIIGHRWWTLTLLTAWTGLMAIGHYDPRLVLPEPKSSRPPDTSAAQTDSPAPASVGSNVSPIRVANGDVVIVVRSDQFFTPDGAQAIRDAVAAIEALDHVESVFWMDEAPPLNIFGLPEPILPGRNASLTRYKAAKQRALDHPLVVGQLMSADTKTLLLMVKIDWLFVTEDADATDKLRDTAAAAVAKYADVTMDFAVTGEVPIRVSRAASTRSNELKYQLIGYAIALLIAFILFRGLSSVIIVALAPAMGVFWTLGVLHFIGLDNNPFNSVIVPVLLCMVGFTDGVHMMVQIRRHRAEGKSPSEAARRSIREVGLACWITSLTTAIGFGSLALAHHEIVREFGYCCVIGVLLTFISVITVIPLACVSPLGRRVHSGYGRNLVDQNLGRISEVIDFVLLRPKVISTLAIVTTLILGLVTLQLRPDERLTSNMSSGSEATMALAHMDQVMGGLETAAVRMQWNANVPAGDPEIGRVAQAVDELLRTEPLIGNPLSIVNLIAALPGEGDTASRMSMLELLPPPLKQAYYRPRDRQASVQFRIQDIGIASYGEVFQRIETGLAQIQADHPDVSISLSGDAVRRWKKLYQIVVDLALSLGSASIIIFVVLSIVYRSLRLGLISVVPNLFPLALTGGLLWVFGMSLEIVSVCAFTVCLGIAVDDTIHFLTRYQEELGGNASPSDAENSGAIRRAFVGVGTALVMTTVVLIVGFSTALLSDARDHQIFAMMGILTIGSALFADLVFLPAMLMRFSKTSQTNR
ncbi:Multidrug resistance protein MdtC [Rubripirellula lacrimiformis]|uniref:Multidrug resistance protein MdtC n=1 Tax=Rubripirellula lacrimiformis TaxID=1930273 RepID=A0A517NH26_9BACT|nr:efflux RND transporter permease subunit [Rubripirellula lacrimiformis]QDT06432.1 Multidrug resistance protein MdtC [Rubripirellula lacrimiformis]